MKNTFRQMSGIMGPWWRRQNYDEFSDGKTVIFEHGTFKIDRCGMSCSGQQSNMTKTKPATVYTGPGGAYTTPLRVCCLSGWEKKNGTVFAFSVQNWSQKRLLKRGPY